MSSSKRKQQPSLLETQPTTYKPTIKALLYLPFRICNPPPAVGKVRSCGVTPLLEVRLQDVLDRRHLPPLGLKDFEEWLVYVERCPETLYFILWLKEYTVKYNQWAANSKPQREGVGEYRMNWSVPSSSHLAMFYARAKQTFFMPNSMYELRLPSHILAPFHASDGSLHPDPIIFAEVEQETRRTLEKSLQRFVHAQLNNVGNNRVLCGIVAGAFFCLAGSIPPLVVNFTTGEERWSRLAAFPGMWIGLTILLAALNGICLGVYIFGDLRQLHKFELSRPQISKPQTLPKPRQRPVISMPMTAPPLNPILPVTQPPAPPRLSVIPPPMPAYIPGRPRSRTSTISSSSSSSSESSSSSSSGSYDEEPTVIHISQAFYDSDVIDGPATSPVAPDYGTNFVFPVKNERADSVDDSYITTASFIHRYDPSLDDDSNYDIEKQLPEERQPISAFDFDALPPRPVVPNPFTPPPPPPPQLEYGILEIKSEIPPLSKSMTPRGLIEWIQLKCNIKKWLVITPSIEAQSPISPRSSFGIPLSRPEPISNVKKGEAIEAIVREHFKKIQAVPAFASLTRVLSPIVVRGQWEIVVRSAAISFLISWIILGSLLAVPVFR
ncbi:hypothetical protein BDZ94DRAFT_1279639 [Collybia nuda]|uniref:Uncharacterized protein n=1 Tax=Collybia nuda TaxID=64659 RepID=A0A9P5YIN0_9AGAR|nr:hypothetical protein BDZ94DRAFT_1279639 [Collybia nuda]